MDASKPIGFTIVDNRSESDKTGGNRSLLITNCEYAIKDIGDADLQPSKLDILKVKLQREFGSQLDGKVVTLNRFRIVLNNRLSFRRQVGGRHQGLIPDAMIGSGCVASPRIEGGYALTDNPQGLPSFTVIIRGNVGSAKFDIKHFETSETVDSTLSRNKDNVLPRVIDNAINKVLPEIRRQI